MLNTSNFWGFKASKTKDQNLIPGTSKWVSNEMNEANKAILQSSKYFSTLVNSELIWLNEQMQEILDLRQDDHLDGLLLLRSPAKLASKESPVRKLRAQTIQDIKSSASSTVVPEIPPQSILVPSANEPEAQEKGAEVEEKPVATIQEQSIPKLLPLGKENHKEYHDQTKESSKAVTSPLSVTRLSIKEHIAAPSELSLMLRSAEKLQPIAFTKYPSNQAPRQNEIKEFDASFEAITKTIKSSKVSKTPNDMNYDKSSNPVTGEDIKLSRSTGIFPSSGQVSNTSKLPSTTPVSDRLSLFASLPSKEPLTVKSSKREAAASSSSAVASASPTANHGNKATHSLYSKIHPNAAKLKPLAKSLLEDHNDEDSPFKVDEKSTASSKKFWVPPSPNRKNLTISGQGSSKHEPKPKDSPLNSIFANALKRARSLISPERRKSTTEGKEAVENKNESSQATVKESDNMSVKRVVNSKNTRGNLMDRLTADTESSAARNIKKLDLQPTSRLYPEVESPLSKRYNESPLANKFNEKKQLPALSGASVGGIPKAPVFKPKSVSPMRSKSPMASVKRKVASPEKVITKEELSTSNGSSIATVARKRLKAQESLTSLSLNKHAVQKRQSNGNQHRINKRMAEERAKVEELRKLRLSVPQKVPPVDDAAIQPVSAIATDKSSKADQRLPLRDEASERQAKLRESHLKLAPGLAPLSDEAMNKRRRTGEKSLDAKVHRMTSTKLGSSVHTNGFVSSTTSTAAKTQNLMKTAKLQQSRMTSTNLQNTATHSTSTTPTANRLSKRLSSTTASPVHLPEIFSEPEDDEEGHILKEWAQSPELKKILQKQQKVNPDLIFGALAPLDMNEIFRSTRTAKFRARTSSARFGAHDIASTRDV